MKVLWIVNMLLPEAAEHLGVKTGFSGTWMINMSREIAHSGDVELAVACVYGNEFKDFTVNNIRYFCIPGNGKTMLFYNEGLVKYVEDKNPAIIEHKSKKITRRTPFFILKSIAPATDSKIIGTAINDEDITTHKSPYISSLTGSFRVFLPFLFVLAISFNPLVSKPSNSLDFYRFNVV